MQFARRHESRGICPDGSGGGRGENEAKRMADCLTVQRPTLPPSFSHICAKWRIENGGRKRKKKENVVQDQQIFSSCSSDGWMGHWTENDRTAGKAGRVNSRQM